MELVLTVSASMVVGLRNMAKARQQIQVALFRVRDGRSVTHLQAIPQAFERAAPLGGVANRSGRARDSCGRYRRLFGARVSFDPGRGNPTSVPTDEPRRRSFRLRGDERGSRVIGADTGVFCALFREI